jgi:hypothetical protein
VIKTITQKLKIICIFFLCQFGAINNFAQIIDKNTFITSTDSIIIAISKLQCQSDSFYPIGLFPSQRISSRQKKIVEDNNIFFSAITLLNLQRVKNCISDTSQLIIESISTKLNASYPKYKNVKGKPTYNFWMSQPESHFPNSKILSKRKKFILPDDFDDTSIIFLTSGQSAAATDSLKQLMALHTNNVEKKVKNSFPEYKNEVAYSTWFGKKMPICFDVCVLSNTLYLVFEKGLTLNQHDSASIKIICDIVKTNKHFNNPEIASPHYRKTEIIIYHISRMLGNKNISGFDNIKQKLINDINKILEERSNNDDFYKVLLYNSLYMLGNKPVAKIKAMPSPNGFSYFYANMVSTFPNPIYKWLNKNDNFCYKYNCNAFNLSIWLEYLVLSNESQF